MTIGCGAGGGHRPLPQWRGWRHHALWAPQLWTVDRNKTYWFHELVLNLPAPLDIQWPKCFQLQGASASWPGALPLDPAIGPRYRLVLRTRHGAPPQPLTPSAAYAHDQSSAALSRTEPAHLGTGELSGNSAVNSYGRSVDVHQSPGFPISWLQKNPWLSMTPEAFFQDPGRTPKKRRTAY